MSSALWRTVSRSVGNEEKTEVVYAINRFFIGKDALNLKLLERILLVNSNQNSALVMKKNNQKEMPNQNKINWGSYSQKAHQKQINNFQ